MTTLNKENQLNILSYGRSVVQEEIEALVTLAETMDHHFETACQIFLQCKGKIIVTGIGKSGHIARKIAATLASTGSPALFMHPTDAAHGDIGLLKPEDVVLALSYSGESHEIQCLLPMIQHAACPLVVISGSKQSHLAKASTVYLDIGISQEACPLNLAPTSSSTAMLVLGDALAMSILQIRGFTAQDFARSHPSGKLGRRLLLRVSDIMRSKDRLPSVSEDASIKDALLEMSHKGLGMTAVVNADQTVIGIFTDGDLRRVLDRPASHAIPLNTTTIATVMTSSFVHIEENCLAVDAFAWMEENRITALLVLDPQKRLVGAFNIHDLLQHDLV
jgi:arabinose-5-phosphate isomerase